MKVALSVSSVAVPAARTCTRLSHCSASIGWRRASCQTICATPNAMPIAADQ
jgi:hypothetical protein